MIIHQPEIIHKEGSSFLFARIEFKEKREQFPRYLWYRIPDTYGKFFTTNTDAFLVLGLLAGMYFQEDIEVRGAVSPRLAYQLDEYKYLLAFRFPRQLTSVEIQYDRLSAVEANPDGVGSSFSGGADSCFTLWKNIPENQPSKDFQISHAVFIHGFDLLPSHKDIYDHLYARFKTELYSWEIDLIPLATNMVSVTQNRLVKLYFDGPLIASPALALGGLFRRYYRPSSNDYYELKKRFYTSDPLMDRLLSTDTLDFINHGSHYRRVEKVEAIADWDFAQRNLWVCWFHRRPDQLENCSRCEKCMRTMMPLYAIGKVERFTTFRKPFTRDRDALWWAWKYNPQGEFESEIIGFVKKHKPRWLAWVRLAAVVGTIRWSITRLVPKFIGRHLRRLGHYSLRSVSPEAYEVPEVTRLIQGEFNDHSSTRTDREGRAYNLERPDRDEDPDPGY